MGYVIDPAVQRRFDYAHGGLLPEGIVEVGGIGGVAGMFDMEVALAVGGAFEGVLTPGDLYLGVVDFPAIEALEVVNDVVPELVAFVAADAAVAQHAAGEVEVVGAAEADVVGYIDGLIVAPAEAVDEVVPFAVKGFGEDGEGHGCEYLLTTVTLRLTFQMEKKIW